jgi:hypothetical protein
MKAAFISSEGYVDLVRETTLEQMQAWNKENEDLGLEEFGYWEIDVPSKYCCDCGKIGETQGHMTCECPGEERCV